MTDLRIIRILLLWGFLGVYGYPVSAALAKDELPSPGRPLTLEQCIAIALKYQPSLRASAANIDAAKARLEQTLASYYPQVNLNNSYSSATNNYSAAIASPAGRRNAYSWTFTDVTGSALTLNQNIYDFGRTANSVNLSRENIKVNQDDFSITRQNVILNVKQAYYNVLQNLHLVRVAEDTVKQNQQRLEQAKGFFEAGTRPKIDVTNAEVNLANAQLALIRVRNNYQVALVSLNNAMGLREDLHLAIEDTMGYQRREIQLEEILRKAYEQRPEISQLKARQRAQEANIKLAESTYYPTLSGSASYNLRTPDFHYYYWDWFFGASLNFPLFSGFSTPNQIAEAKATLRNLQAQMESLRLSIRLEVEQAYLALREAEERIRVTEKTVAQAQENYELASGRYQVGVGFPLEVTDAEVLLANARANHIQALADYRIAEARLDKAMGVFR